jgi:hypothetical protein
MAKTTSDPLGTLSIGNVVTTATTLYKSNFKRYLQVSLRSTAWILAMGFSAVGFALIGGILYGLTTSWLVIIPVVLGWIVLAFYFSAKNLTDRAVICRLAYQELINAPETIAVATKYLLPRTWGFLRLSLWLGLYMSLVAILGYIALIIVVGILSMIVGFLVNLVGSGQFSALNNPILYLFIGLIGIGLLLFWVAVVVRYYASWFIAELPLAVESTTSANFSIGRSRSLSSVAIRQVVLIITIAFFITLPLNSVGNSAALIGQVMVSNPTTTDSASVNVMGGILVLIGTLLSLITELFVMPFWQIIKAIVYYDLRNRREGGDLMI